MPPRNIPELKTHTRTLVSWCTYKDKGEINNNVFILKNQVSSALSQHFVLVRSHLVLTRLLGATSMYSLYTLHSKEKTISSSWIVGVSTMPSRINIDKIPVLSISTNGLTPITNISWYFIFKSQYYVIGSRPDPIILKRFFAASTVRKHSASSNQ